MRSGNNVQAPDIDDRDPDIGDYAAGAAKGAVKDGAKGAAKGAVKGALKTGTPHGAAAGAAKGGAQAGIRGAKREAGDAGKRGKPQSNNNGAQNGNSPNNGTSDSANDNNDVNDNENLNGNLNESPNDSVDDNGTDSTGGNEPEGNNENPDNSNDNDTPDTGDDGEGEGDSDNNNDENSDDGSPSDTDDNDNGDGESEGGSSDSNSSPQNQDSNGSSPLRSPSSGSSDSDDYGGMEQTGLMGASTIGGVASSNPTSSSSGDGSSDSNADDDNDDGFGNNSDENKEDDKKGVIRKLVSLWAKITAMSTVVSIMLPAIIVTIIVVTLLSTLAVIGSVAVASTENIPESDCGANLIDINDELNELGKGDEAMRYNNANMIYSIMTENGFDEYEIAGVLGNMDAESGLDPTTIEGMYDHNYVMDTDPEYAAVGLEHGSDATTSYIYKPGDTTFPSYDEYTSGDLADKYMASTGTTPWASNDFYYADDGLLYPGIGMVQMTGENARQYIMDAHDAGTVWWAMEYQIAYMMVNGAPTGYANFWNEYKDQKFKSASEASTFFGQYFEGQSPSSNPSTFVDRASKSETWYIAIQTMNVEDVDTGSIVDSLVGEGDASDIEYITNTENSCQSASGGTHVGDGTLNVLPMNDYTITQSFGNVSSLGYYDVHAGIDLVNAADPTIYAAGDGTVVYAGCASGDACGTSGTNGQAYGTGFGQMVMIDHGNGVETIYGHMATTPEVSVGDTVTAGDVIGTMGSTGNSTGPHLHFEVHENKIAVNPDDYIDITKNAVN